MEQFDKNFENKHEKFMEWLESLKKPGLSIAQHIQNRKDAEERKKETLAEMIASIEIISANMQTIAIYIEMLEYKMTQYRALLKITVTENN